MWPQSTLQSKLKRQQAYHSHQRTRTHSRHRNIEQQAQDRAGNLRGFAQTIREAQVKSGVLRRKRPLLYGPSHQLHKENLPATTAATGQEKQQTNHIVIESLVQNGR